MITGLTLARTLAWRPPDSASLATGGVPSAAATRGALLAGVGTIFLANLAYGDQDPNYGAIHKKVMSTLEKMKVELTTLGSK